MESPIEALFVKNQNCRNCAQDQSNRITESEEILKLTICLAGTKRIKPVLCIRGFDDIFKCFCVPQMGTRCNFRSKNQTNVITLVPCSKIRVLSLSYWYCSHLSTVSYLIVTHPTSVGRRSLNEKRNFSASI